MVANHLGSLWRHAIVAMDGVTAARERLEPGLSVTFPEIVVRKGDLLGNIRRFRAVIHGLGSTTMLTHNFGSIEWAIANCIAPVHHVHVEDGFGPDERSMQLPRRVWLRRAFLRKRTIILPSQNLMRIARQIWRLDQNQLHYVPNGIDLARFPVLLPRPQISRDGPLIGTVAALRPEKNLGRLIRAFHLATTHSPARLLIIGDGPQRPELEALAASLDLGGCVHFAGHVTHPESLLQSLDIFAMSSDTEQMPISLLEAMAAGLPVAATDVGDTALMLPEAGRAFVTACDDAALAGALLTLIGNPELCRSLGQASRATAAAKFDQSQMFDRWSSLLRSDALSGEAQTQ